ncbi:MAG: lipoprotein [Gammaproteobacteria bacterium]|nr:lipoprotein [Gammaproteobacteria bacterium]
MRYTVSLLMLSFTVTLLGCGKKSPLTLPEANQHNPAQTETSTYRHAADPALRLIAFQDIK